MTRLAGLRLTCTRCHTTAGVNGVIDRLENLYGSTAWDRDTVKAYLTGMHNVRPFMPPVPGSDQELGALTDYLLSLQKLRRPLVGVQSAGLSTTSTLTAPAVGGAE